MAKTRLVQVPQTVPDGADDISIRFYVAISANGSKVPSVHLHQETAGAPVVIDRPLSDITSLTTNQKNNLRTMLTAIRDELYTLEGFT